MIRHREMQQLVDDHVTYPALFPLHLIQLLATAEIVARFPNAV